MIFRILHSALICLLGYLLIGLFLHSANAQTMSNQNYILRTQGFNSISGLAEGQNTKVRSTIGEISTEGFEGVNYKVRAGFENAKTILPFSIALSSNLIDFGELLPTNPIIRTLDMEINSENAYGYSVIAYEDKPLTSTSSDNIFIPNTTCDNGRCDSIEASVWTNTLAYGFGYRCDNLSGRDCDTSFERTNFYKTFANKKNEEEPQLIVSGIGANNRQSRISYKVNVSGSQQKNIYTNTITYIAVPNY